MTAHPHAHVLDRLIGAELPRFTCAADVPAFEAQAPWPARVAAASTYDALRLGAALAPQAPALHFLPDADPDAPAHTWTHAQFFGQVTQAGNLFHSLGVGAGDVVSLLLPLLPQAFVALYGAQAVGVANPVNAMLSAAQLAGILQAAGTRVLVALGTGSEAGDALWAKLQQVLPQLPALRSVLVVGGGLPDLAALDQPPALLHFDTTLAQQPADRLLSPRLPTADDIAGYFHTGGTTGTPKLVRHRHGQQVYQAWALRLMGIALPGQAVLFGLPLFHVGGALTQGLAALANGGHLVVLSAMGWRHPQAVRHVWRLVQRYRPALLGGVPTVLGGVLQVPVGEADISSLQVALAGGSAIPLAVIQACEERLHLPVLQVYGMTETASVHTMTYLHRPRQAGSSGWALPYSRTRVLRADLLPATVQDCAPEQIGVVAMAGPGCFDGYRSEQHNAGAFTEPGWVNSGDLGRLDADGALWLTGRAKDVIIRGGHNIDPAPLEELLYQHPAVLLAALVGQPDAHAGELPVAYVQLKPGQDVAPSALIAYLREQSPERAAVPVALHVIDAMPLTAVGKIFKPALRDDAVCRVAEGLLRGALGDEGWTCAVLADARQGQLLRVVLATAPGPQRQAQLAAVAQVLGPLTLPHDVV